MLDPLVLIQTVTLGVVVLVIDTWERKRPGHPVDRRKDLGIDLLAIGICISFGEWVRIPILAGIELTRGFVSPLAALPVLLKILLSVATADFALYWVHRAMHASDFLWNTHRFHHSITQLYWLSGARTSVTHLFLFALTQMTIAYVLFGLTVPEAAFAFSFGIAVNIWVHANIRVDLGPLQWLVITPGYHRIHHASDSRSRRNLGFVFTIWDRAFGTYLDPRSITEAFALGSAEPDKGLGRQVAGV